MALQETLKWTVAYMLQTIVALTIGIFLIELISQLP